MQTGNHQILTLDGTSPSGPGPGIWFDVTLKEIPSSEWKNTGKQSRSFTAWPLYVTTNDEICLLTPDCVVKIVKINDLDDKCQQYIQYIRSKNLPNKLQFDELKQSGKLINNIDDDIKEIETCLKGKKGTSRQGEVRTVRGEINGGKRNTDLKNKKRAIMAAMSRL